MLAFSYTSSVNLKVKVLDFVKSGGPEWTVDGTIFEMWLGPPTKRQTLSSPNNVHGDQDCL